MKYWENNQNVTEVQSELLEKKVLTDLLYAGLPVKHNKVKR